MGEWTPGGRILSLPPSVEASKTTVREWRNEEGNGWALDELSTILTPNETEAIKAMKLAESEQEDLLSWPHTRNGVFSVRSAYHLEVQRKNGNVGPSVGDHNLDVWRKTWKALTPSRVKVTMWRALKNGLPTMNVLARRGLNVDCICPRCGEAPETVTHMALQCKEARLLWKLSPLRLDSQVANCSLMEWGEEFGKKCKMKGAWELAMMVVWQSWRARNLWVFERKTVDPVVQCAKMLGILGEYEAACTRDQPPSEPPTQVGLGMLVRDHVGDALMSAGESGCENLTVKHAEAKAVMFGLRYAFDAGCRALEVETDCQALATLLQAKSREISATQVLVNDILNLAKQFTYCSFGFNRRSCNSVAHSMAQAALHFEETLVWMEDCPPVVTPLVLADKILCE
ncbi:uncharacterized protein [Spinacia oleracea]|uniref:RNase H type-1 domain-containing protein n=1 Tax=Spinacia oleracea TaxID=3562 RepID=A0ABM3QQ88_SPIOL|nr:uncharacterized protein LOC110804263 [Spinacia oleracea]